LTSRIATGGMAEVYVGRHITPEGVFGPMVAVKRLLPHLVKDSAIVRMFLNEARITAQIDHPNVVRIFELGQQGDEPYIAMELLEGRTFSDLRAREAENARRMRLPVALRILCDACRGLDAAHRAVSDDGQPLALVHRDFTPDNIHVGVHGEVKVIDFGIAKTTPWGAGTEPGTLKGKFFYMSPEMILARPVDHRADLFAAGVMLYEQLCGRRPFTGVSVDEVVMKIAEGKLSPPSTFDPSVPRALEAVCLKSLAKNPDDRFPSLHDFVEAIEALGGEAQVATPQEVGEYVSAIFPEKTDERRKTLRKAREADPSVPGTRVPDALLSPAQGAPVAPSAERATEAVPAFQPTVKPAPVAVKPGPTPGRGGRIAAIVAAVVLLGLAGAAAIIFHPGPAGAEVVLQEALAAKDGSARVKALVNLLKSPDASDAHFTRAAALVADAKAWEAAAPLADAWVQRSPKSVDAQLLLAHVSMETRRGKRAEQALAQAQALAPTDVRPDVLMAQLRELQGDVPGALDAWTRAAKKQPDDVSILAHQGHFLSQSGKLPEAETVLKDVLKKRFDPAIAAELGFVKFRQEQPDEALKLLTRVTREAPTLMEGHYYLAAVLYQKGDVKQARAEYLAADARAGADTRPLLALCDLEKQQEGQAELASVQAKLKERFPADAAQLLKQCAP
jgi:Tfp pilus assembly protein PilF